MKLDYIESTGEQWIDSGLTVSDSMRIRMRVEITRDNCSMFGCRGDGTSSYFQCYNYQNKCNMRYAKISANALNMLRNQEYEIEMGHINRVPGVLKIGDSTVRSTLTLVPSVYNLALFADNRSGNVTTNMYGTCSMFQIFDANTGVRDYQPLLALPGTTYVDGNSGASVTASDFKPGLYDYVSGRFFVNQATTGEDFRYIPDNEVWYAADSKQTLYTSTGVVSHEFADGRGVLKFTSAVTTVQAWLRGTGVTAVVLPKTVKTLSENCLWSCSSLETINIGSVTEIKRNAFSGCSLLNIKRLPDILESIGETAFGYCTSCTFSEIPASVTTVEYHAFQNFMNFSNRRPIYFLGTPTSISSKAFYRTNSSYITPSDIYVPWSEGEVEGAPWSAPASTIHYNSTTTA